MTGQVSKSYMDDLLDMKEDTLDAKFETSEIVQFFNGSKVFVTGATGFMGKLLVEKLLRSCPGISVLYIIVRPKKGKSSAERFEENFNDVIFATLKMQQPDFLEKVVMLEGDTGEVDFGLTPKDKDLLLQTNVIFHAAATVRFDEKLRVATNINVRGVKELLTFAKKMPHLKSFVHISTAFSHCVLKAIDEEHYPPPVDGDKLLTFLDFFEDDKIDKMTPALLENWPNTYAFTKAIAENTVLKHSTGIPTCIVRPSIVISTANEPIPGWTNNLYGATGVVVGAGVGLIRTLHCVPENIADVIPADYVIANIIAAAWDTAKLKSTPANVEQSNHDSKLSDIERVPIYNVVSSCQNPLCWGEFMRLNRINGIVIPSVKVMWYYFLTLCRYKFLNQILIVLLHLIPAAILDGLCYLTGRKPKLLDTYKKIHKFSTVIHYFSTQEWRFRNDTVLRLWGKMKSVDQELFNFHMGNLNWTHYYYDHMRGLRTFIVKDPMDTLEVALARYKKLMIAHYTLATVFFLSVAWMIMNAVLFVWSFCPLANSG